MKSIIIGAFFAEAIVFLGYPPKAPNYAWWARIYGKLAPTEVCDMCGGWPGVTTWEEVSEPCAVWTVTMLRCGQVCNNSNRLQGFGKCMMDCGVVPPKCSDCGAGQLKLNITDYCTNTCGKWNDCGCADSEFASSDEWMTCISTCVYDCGPSLQLELDMGFDIAWRDRKCPALFFACGGDKSAHCTKVPACESMWAKDCVEKVCAPPVGTGLADCFHDDPFCGARALSNSTLSDQCVKLKSEGQPCAKYPLWVEAKSFPECEPELECDAETGFCEPIPPPPPTNATNSTEPSESEDDMAFF